MQECIDCALRLRARHSALNATFADGAGFGKVLPSVAALPLLEHSAEAAIVLDQETETRRSPDANR